MFRSKIGLLTIVMACGLPWAAVARADDAGIRTASGEQLYSEGKELLKKGQNAEACAKFAASQKLDPASATLIGLGLCHEGLGKTATAYGYFVSARTAAKKEQGPQEKSKLAFADEHITALQVKLAKITVAVPDTIKLDGLKIGVDDLTVDPLNATPMDAGAHVVWATAPGYERWSTSITIKDGELPTVTIGPLKAEPIKPVDPPTKVEPKPDPTPPPVTPIPEPKVDRTQRVVGWTVGAVGLVGLGVGGALGLAARSRWNTAQPDCPNNVCKTASAQSAAEDAKRFGNISTAAVVLGGVGLVSGLVLVLTAPSAPETKTAHVQVAPAVAPGTVGLVVGGSF